MKKRTTKLISILLTLVMLLGLLPTTAFAAEKETILSMSATVTLPNAGAHPVETGTPGDSSYKIMKVRFSEKDPETGVYTSLESTDTFEAGKTYMVNVLFRANSGYKIDRNTVSASINGQNAAWWSTISDGWDSQYYYIEYTVPEDVPAAKTPITSVKVSDVTVPVIGETPDFDITLTGDGVALYEYDEEEWEAITWDKLDQESGEWEPMDKDTSFVTGIYCLGVALQFEEGYAFTDDTKFYYNDDELPEYGGSYESNYQRWEGGADIYLYFTVEETATPATYTVSFNANGGTGTMEDATSVSGEYTLPACTFTAPSDKQFKAWSVDGVEKAVGDKITVTADTTVTAVWETVSEYTKKGDIDAVTATAPIAPVLGATTSAVSFTITDPTDYADKGIKLTGSSWYKKDASSIYGWTQCSNGVDTFEEGTYRLEVQLRSESNDAKEYHAMSGETTFTVNGVQWSGKEPFRDYYASSGYGYRFFVSPEFTLGGKTLDSIAVTTPPTKTAYREGEDFSSAGMVVTATYTDSSTAPVAGYTVTDGSAMTAGKTSVTISYTEGGVTKETTQAITVAKEYTVTVEGGSGGRKYIAGEEVTISAFVSGGRKFKEWQGTDGLTFTSGDKNSQTATFTMPAHDVTVTAVTGPAEYYVSVTGGSGTGTYETGATVTIVADAPEAGKQFKTWVVGDGKVLNFTESTITDSTAKFIMPGEAVRIYAEYEDIPAAKALDSIAITTPPTKTAYTAGESFDPAGMVVTATYSDSSTAPVAGYTVSPAGALSESDAQITVSYTEGGVTKTATQAITVTAVPAPQTATIVVKKTDNEDKALVGATFALTLPGSVAPTYTAVSDANGLATFTGVADGSYTLTENEAPDGYIRSEKSYEVYVRNGDVTIILAQAPNGQQYDNNAPVVFVNHPVPAPDIVVWKTDGGQNYIAGASFALTKEGETTPAYTATSDGTGKVLFAAVADGTYILTETAAPEGYIKTDKTYKFLVENGEVSLYEDGDPVAYQGLNIANEPIVTVTLPITKVVAKGGTVAPGQQTFTFEIKEFGNSNFDVSAATILENTITTNGVGSFEGVLKFTLPARDAEDILSEGLIIAEKNDGATNWTYDTKEWTVYANNAATSGEQWSFLNDDIAPNGAERATFTNTYTKNASSGGGGSGSSGGSSGSSSSSSKPVLNKEDHMAFLQGYADGTFRPEKNMTRAQVTVMFARLLVEKMEVGKTYSNSFSDVPADYWAANEIGYMEKFGIINGFTDGTFRPNDPVTRAQFAAIACRFEELTEGTKTFSDVPADHWAAKYISYAAERGWVGGFTDGTFRPNNYITRAQVAAVTCRLLERNADEKYIEKHFDDLTYTFSDMTEQHFAYWYALEASNGHDYTKKADKETWSSLLK